MKIWMDERVMDASEARISVLDHGFLYGDGVFEGMRVHAGRAFRLDDHLARLMLSARAIGLEPPGGAEALRAIVLDTARALACEDCYLRLIVSRGEGPLGINPARCPRPRIVCIADQLTLYGEDKAREGVDVVTVSVRRPPADVLDPRVKSLNYLNNVLAIGEARSRGADEALVLNQQGAVAEASAANVFVVHGRRCATPPCSDGALDGIVRRSVLELAPAIGLEPCEQRLGRIDLLGADEVFLTGSGAGIVAVRSLDGHAIGAGRRGPVTERVIGAFERMWVTHGTPLWARGERAQAAGAPAA
jgi:branched-chain amino acid aminotransferase